VSDIKHGGFAFPQSNLDVAYSDYIGGGMTLRDWFAGQAMQGLLSNPKMLQEIMKNGGAYGGWIESSAWGWADAMLAAREEKP
jgi:hypothetical protein